MNESNYPAQPSAQDFSGEAVDASKVPVKEAKWIADAVRDGRMSHGYLWVDAADFVALRQRLTEAESRNAQLAGEVEELRKDKARLLWDPKSEPKVGDICERCGGPYLQAPGGTGIYHSCHT